MITKHDLLDHQADAHSVKLHTQRQRTETWLAWFIGITSFAAYYLKLCPSVYPGNSAFSVATVLDLLPQAPMAHPVWRFAARAVTAIPLFELPFRLNLFSAFCGALAVAMLFRLASRVLFECIHNEPLLYPTPYRSEDDESEARRASPAESASTASGTTDYVSAMLGGLLTAFAFAFSAPFWSASVSLHPQTFDLLLFFLMVGFLARYTFTGKIVCCISAMFLCGLGMMESVLFVATAPVVLFLLFRAGTQNGQLSESFVLLSLFSCLLGIGCGTAVLIYSAGAGVALDLHRLATLFSDISHSHRAELLQGLPHTGWLLVLLETIIPLIVVFLGATRFFTSYEPLARWLWGLLNAVFTLLVAVCLLGISHTPWGLARQGFHLPVIASLATALTAGILFAYWRLLRTTPQLTYDIEDCMPPSRSQRTLAFCMTGFIFIVVLLAPLHNLRDADGRKGAFADPLARELLALTSNANCLVTDGLLDMHMLILTHLQHRKLTLVTVSPDYDQPPASTAVKAAARSTVSRKGPPQKESAADFIERWLRAKPEACDQVAIMVQPTFWTHAGLCAVPNGLVYLGSGSVQTIDGPQLLRKHEVVWNSLTPLLSRDQRHPPALAAMLASTSRQASRVANDLGVFLEDRGCLKEAVRAYNQAQNLDPDNLCAAFNRYGLLLRNASLGSPAEQELLIQRVAERLDRGFMFARCVTLYGSLHSQPSDLLERHTLAAQHPLVIQWIAYCQNQMTAGLRPNPVACAASDKDTALAQAVLALRTGETADAETRLRAFVKTSPDNLSGWSILADLLLNSGKTNEVAVLVIPAMRTAAGEKGHELVDMVEGLLALHQAPPHYRDARTFFTRALAHHPGLKEAQDQLLQTDCSLGDASCVETDASNILKTDADHSAANAILGGIRLSQKRYDEAEKHLRRSIATLPTAGALNDLAELLRAKNKLADAEKSARHAIRLSPNFYQAWDTLGNVLTDQNRLSEADAAMRCALALCASDPRLHLNLARLNLRLNRRSEARQILTLAAPMVANATPSVGKDFASLSRELDTPAIPH